MTPLFSGYPFQGKEDHRGNSHEDPYFPDPPGHYNQRTRSRLAPYAVSLVCMGGLHGFNECSLDGLRS